MHESVNLTKGGKQMKPNQIKGGISILSGILLFIPFWLNYMQMTMMGVTGGASYIDTFKHIGDAKALTAVALVFGLLSLIAAVVLVVYGILLFLNIKGEKLGGKMSLILPIAIGAFAILAGILAIADVADLQSQINAMLDPSDPKMTYVALGGILFLVFGVVTIAATITAKFLVKEKQAPAPAAKK